MAQPQQSLEQLLNELLPLNVSASTSDNDNDSAIAYVKFQNE